MLQEYVLITVHIIVVVILPLTMWVVHMLVLGLIFVVFTMIVIFMNFHILYYIMSNLVYKYSFDLLSMTSYVVCLMIICEGFERKNLPRNAFQRREQRSIGEKTCDCTPMEMIRHKNDQQGLVPYLIGEQPLAEFHNTSTYDDYQEHPKMKAWDTRPMDMKKLEEAHHLAGENPTTQHHDAKMHINDQERGPPERKDLNTRPRDITRLTHIQHPPEPPTTLHHDENMQNNDQKQQALPKLNALNTRPINMEGLNEKHHLEGEQPTTQLYDANARKLINENHNSKTDKEDQHKKIEKQLEKSLPYVCGNQVWK